MQATLLSMLPAQRLICCQRIPTAVPCVKLATHSRIIFTLWSLVRAARKLVYCHAQVDSHEKSLAKGRDEIQHLVLQLEIMPHGDTIEGAHRLYRIALQRNFTRGRRTAQVSCTYQQALTFTHVTFHPICHSCAFRYQLPIIFGSLRYI